MKAQKKTFELIRTLTGQRAIFTVPRVFVSLCGTYEAAALLSQILYWSRPGVNEGWFYKTRAAWAAELGLSEKKIRVATARLLAMDLIETKLEKVSGAPTLWYSPCSENISKSLGELVDNSVEDLWI